MGSVVRFFHLEVTGAGYICTTFRNTTDGDVWKITEIREPETLQETFTDTIHLIPCPDKAKKELSLVYSVPKSSGVFVVSIFRLTQGFVVLVVLTHVQVAFVSNAVMPWDLFFPRHPGSCRYSSYNFSQCNTAIWS